MRVENTCQNLQAIQVLPHLFHRPMSSGNCFTIQMPSVRRSQQNLDSRSRALSRDELATHAWGCLVQRRPGNCPQTYCQVFTTWAPQSASSQCTLHHCTLHLLQSFDASDLACLRGSSRIHSIQLARTMDQAWQDWALPLYAIITRNLHPSSKKARLTLDC